MSNITNDEYMETLEKRVASAEKRCEALEQEFFILIDVIKDIRMMNSFGKTKDIADEIDSLIKKYSE
jgi:phage anti-repressor protein